MRCRTCDVDRPADDFYAGSTECASCKRERSRQNRLLAARKLAFADRVLDLLAELVSRGWRPDLCEHRAIGGHVEACGDWEVQA